MSNEKGLNPIQEVKEEENESIAPPASLWAIIKSFLFNKPETTKQNLQDGLPIGGTTPSKNHADVVYADVVYADNAYVGNAYADNAYVGNAYADNAYAGNAYVDNASAAVAYAGNVPAAGVGKAPDGGFLSNRVTPSMYTISNKKNKSEYVVGDAADHSQEEINNKKNRPFLDQQDIWVSNSTKYGVKLHMHWMGDGHMDVPKDEIVVPQEFLDSKGLSYMSSTDASVKAGSCYERACIVDSMGNIVILTEVYDGLQEWTEDKKSKTDTPATAASTTAAAGAHDAVEPLPKAGGGSLMSNEANQKPKAEIDNNLSNLVNESAQNAVLTQTATQTHQPSGGISR